MKKISDEDLTIFANSKSGLVWYRNMAQDLLQTRQQLAILKEAFDIKEQVYSKLLADYTLLKEKQA